jgi:hypothetical protein
MRPKVRVRMRRREHQPTVGLVRTTWLRPPSEGAALYVKAVLHQALARIGEAGRRFAQCLSETQT